MCSLLRHEMHISTLSAPKTMHAGPPCDYQDGPCTMTIQKGTRVLISLWDSLMFGRVPGTRLNMSESHSEISTRVPFCIELAGPPCGYQDGRGAGGGRCRTAHKHRCVRLGRPRSLASTRHAHLLYLESVLSSLPPPDFVPGSPHVILLALRQALCFVPGSPHAILLALRQALVSYQDNHM